MQIKTQLDIELNESDIKAAIALYLTQNNVSVSDDELSAIKFVNSRNDGIKANLTVSNEKSTAPEEQLPEAPVMHSVGTFQEEVKCIPDIALYLAQNAEEASEELLEASTVEDVIPSIDELVEQQQQVPTTGKPLFGNKSLYGPK